ncbi:MAG: hypothetical protein ACLFUB_01215 [Cyclobacteriaceae bacterium]
MNIIKLNDLQFHYYLNWHMPSDSNSLCLIPIEDSLKKIMQEGIPADKMIYEIFTFFDEFFYEERGLFDFRPLFKETIEIFELEIDKKAISSEDLSGIIHEYLVAA